MVLAANRKATTMTLNIHIHTQYQENCGDAAQPYWKFKGGDTFVVVGAELPMNDRIGAVAAAVVESVRGQVEYANDASIVEIIDWEIVEGDTLTQWERDQQEFEGRITSPSPRITVAAVPVAA